MDQRLVDWLRAIREYEDICEKGREVNGLDADAVKAHFAQRDAAYMRMFEAQGRALPAMADGARF